MARSHLCFQDEFDAPLLLALGLTFVACTAVAQSAPPLVVHNNAMDFVRFWDAAKNLPKDEQLAQFKTRVAPGFPEFYGIARYSGDVTQAKRDAQIQRSIDQFAPMRDAYITRARNFETELPKNISSFQATFPDFVPSGDIYVLHSLDEMDGGTRTIGGKNYLIFGVDGMVKYHGNGSDTPFFHHELFHTYHTAVANCGEENWVHLWREGLAVYVAKVLNPQANDVELLLDVPNHMARQTQAVLPSAWAQLEKVLDDTDNESYSGLFLRAGDKTGLPPRRGYYLGSLVAQELGRARSVQQLAKLGCEPVRQLVHEAVHTLSKQAQ